MEQRGELFTAILDYAAKGIVPEFTGELKMCFAFVRSTLDRDAVAWEEKRQKRAAAGRLGGLAKVANATNAKQNKQAEANQAVNVNVPVNVKDGKEAKVANATDGDRPFEGPSAEKDLAPWVEALRHE